MSRIVPPLIIIPLLFAVFLPSTKCYRNPVQKITLAEFLFHRLHKFGRNNPSEKQVTNIISSKL